MKIIINENQIRLLHESLDTVSYEMKESIAVWCLINDFVYYNPDRLIGRGTSVANDEETNKEICQYIMNSNVVTLRNDRKIAFSLDNEDDEFNIFEINANGVRLYLRIPSNLPETFCEEKMEEIKMGNTEDELLEWFYQMYR
jgi:hypothetical protein